MSDDKKTGKKSGIDADAVRELSALLKETGLSEIEIEHNGARIRVSNVSAAAPATAPAPAAAPAAGAGHSDAANPGAVTSPMVGTVYTAAEPGQPPFVKIGQQIKEGDTLFIIEAMKTMNAIPSPRSGVVKEILVENGAPVEFGQTLLVLG
jgi:acetyl-CoA carboxylase biotin carboxyl carrier protein